MKINWFKIDKMEIYDNINELILLGNPKDYSEFFIYLKQGYYCKDCFSSPYNCKCNKCEYCNFNFCLCVYNIKQLAQRIFYYENERNLIRSLIFKWILKNLNKEILGILYLNLKFKNYYLKSETSSEIQKIKEIIKELSYYENKLV